MLSCFRAVLRFSGKATTRSSLGTLAGTNFGGSVSLHVASIYVTYDCPLSLLRSIDVLQQRSDQGHIEVVGNLDLAQAVNASLYFIRSSIRPDWPLGLSPGGLASNSYNGHTFWDQVSVAKSLSLSASQEVARTIHCCGQRH